MFQFDATLFLNFLSLLFLIFQINFQIVCLLIKILMQSLFFHNFEFNPNKVINIVNNIFYLFH